MSYRRAKERSFITRARVAIGELLKPRFLREQPPETARCSRCGYTKGPRTVLIPAGQCPSCGSWFMVSK